MRPVTGEWFDDLAGAASGPAGETMRPVMGPTHPPLPGPSRRCLGKGVCVLAGCSVSTHGGENLATSAGQDAPEETRRVKNDNVKNYRMKNGEAPAPLADPAAAAAARP